MTINPDGRWNMGDARFTRRSGLLRTQSLRLFALREPAAIARGGA